MSNRGAGSVRYVVYSWVPEEMLPEWNEWHNQVHIPRVLASPEMRGARKYRVLETTVDLGFEPQFVTVYELDRLEDFQSYRAGRGAELRREYDERYGDVGKTARMLLAGTPLEGIRPAESAGDLAHARELFEEYGRSLGFDLSFQDFERELAGLPGEYAPPQGSIFLAVLGEEVMGCAAFRPLGPGICEMKRLYVRPAFRGRMLGRRLAEAVIAEAKRKGYRRMRLDTVPAMGEAIVLYRSLGFRPIEPYRANPIPGAMFFEKDLST
jgi:ribosomal protein S18 acetylase RimI-like enzyme